MARGVCVVNVSQCWRGEVAGHSYAVGAARLGALGGGRMTPEAVYARLHCLLAEAMRHSRRAGRIGNETPNR